MKKILNALFLTLLAVFTFSSCSDVPAPYDILGEGDVPGLTGDGTKENPYTISDLKAKADGTTVAWVQAYIVAGIKSSADMSIGSESDVVFGTQPTDVKATAFLIADNSGESDYKNCSAVNLNGSGTGCKDVKAALNLVDNATTPLPRLITFKGTLVKNTWGLSGLKEVTAAILENGTLIGEGGESPEPPVGKVTFFEESFASNKGAFTIEDKTRPSKVNEIWKWETYTPEGGTASTYMKASAFISATEKEVSESWLISPAVNLTKATSASLTFEHAHKFCGEPTKELTVWVKESSATDWAQAAIPTYGTNNDWKFVSSGNIDLASYVGKNIQVAFKYMSTTSDVGTWEVRNVKVTGEGESGGDEPIVPGNELLKNGGFENWIDDATPVDWKSTSTAGNATLQKSTDKRSGQFSVFVEGNTSSNKRLGSVEMILKAGTYTFSAYFKAASAEGKASAALGYVLIGDDGKVSGDYKYDDYVNDLTNSSWIAKSYTFTLSVQQKICLVVMNSKKPGGDLLIDDASLKTSDGGIVNDGGVEPEPEPELNPYESNISMPTISDSKVDYYYDCTINGYPALKLGKNGFAGKWTTDVLGATKTKLSFYSVAWNGKNETNLTVDIVDGGTFAGGETSKTISLIANTGFAGSGNSYSIVTNNETDFHEYNLIGTTPKTRIKFSTDKERGAVFGVKIK